jgi:hypothetical protein
MGMDHPLSRIWSQESGDSLMIPEGKSRLILRGFQGLKMPDPLSQRRVGIIKP